MFTGIIEEIGTMRSVKRGAKSVVLDIAASRVLEDVSEGDSIAVNGVCLTVTSFAARHFTADVMHETLRRSSLANLTSGKQVNLERAMALGGRFGGHIVSGHIDGTGTIARIDRDDTAIWYTVRTAPQILRYVVEKGSIAIDGISLTVARVDDMAGTFAVSTIPHTNDVTTLPQRRAGDIVNLECDVIGKYVERLATGAQAVVSGVHTMQAGLSSAAHAASAKSLEGSSSRHDARAPAGAQGNITSGITRDFLAANGF